MANKGKLATDVYKKRAMLTKVKVPKLKKDLIDLKTKMAQQQDPDEKKSIKAQIDVKNAEIKAAAAGVQIKDSFIAKVKDMITNEEAQATITTTSVGNAASQGGSANFAPKMGGGMGMMKRHDKTKKKKNKKSITDALDYLSNLFIK